MERTTVIFNLDWCDIIQDYPDDIRLEFYEAILKYASTGIVPKLSSLALMAFKFAKKEIDKNNEKFSKKLEAKKSAGAKGGKQKAKNQKDVAKSSKNDFATKSKQEVANVANVAEYENENENEYEVCVNAHTRTWEDVRSELYNSPIWRESVAKAHSLSDTDINGCIDGVVAYLSTQSDCPSVADAKRLLPRQVEIYRRTPRGDINDRLDKFKNEIADAKNKQGYSSDTCNSFFQHWSQSDDNGVMRFEAELYWDTTKRLELWNARR